MTHRAPTAPTVPASDAMLNAAPAAKPQVAPIPGTPTGVDDVSLRDRYEQVKDRIAAAAKRSRRSPGSIVLVAVTKFAEPDQIRELIRLGHSDFGENKVQQLIQRATLIEEWHARQRIGHAPAQPGSSAAAAVPVRWHMIGHLQRNKARKVVELCRMVHSVDSLRLAEELQLAAARREQPIDVLLQVNCSGEASKFGCAIGAAIHLAEQIETMVQVRLRGMMTMAALTSDSSSARSTFARARELFTEIRDSGAVNPNFNILSMGMSGDFEVAIEEGANMVRVGSALFGEPKSVGPDTDDDAE